jgi:hypothetical protein
MKIETRLQIIGKIANWFADNENLDGYWIIGLLVCWWICHYLMIN